MIGRVRPEPPGRLLELPLAADAVPAAGLVPRDREVDEALEEVALLGRRGPPDVLELLVGGEVLAVANQVESALELVRDTLTSPSSILTGYVSSWIARSNSFSPVRTSYCQPCHGQLRT